MQHSRDTSNKNKIKSNNETFISVRMNIFENLCYGNVKDFVCLTEKALLTSKLITGKHYIRDLHEKSFDKSIIIVLKGVFQS